MTKPVYIASTIALAAISVSIGCGPKEGLGIVTGNVTVDGAPVETGKISFFPLGGIANPVGADVANGRYSIEAPLGESKVDIRVPVSVGEKRLYDTPDSPIKQILAESLPDKYNNESELRIVVQAGDNRKDFELSTSK
jgi:hypothetical protein